MAEDAHHVRKRNYCIARVIYIYELVCSVEVLSRTDGEVERGRFVHRPFHLVYVPVCTEERCVCYADVRPYVLHLLGVPQRECVVVSVRHEYTVFADRIQIVSCHLDSSISVASVMVVPVFSCHEGRYSEGEDRYSGRYGCLHVPAVLECAHDP